MCGIGKRRYSPFCGKVWGAKIMGIVSTWLCDSLSICVWKSFSAIFGWCLASTIASNSKFSFTDVEELYSLFLNLISGTEVMSNIVCCYLEVYLRRRLSLIASFIALVIWLSDGVSCIWDFILITITLSHLKFCLNSLTHKKLHRSQNEA